MSSRIQQNIRGTVYPRAAETFLVRGWFMEDFGGLRQWAPLISCNVMYKILEDFGGLRLNAIFFMEDFGGFVMIEAE